MSSTGNSVAPTVTAGVSDWKVDVTIASTPASFTTRAVTKYLVPLASNAFERQVWAVRSSAPGSNAPLSVATRTSVNGAALLETTTGASSATSCAFRPGVTLTP